MGRTFRRRSRKKKTPRLLRISSDKYYIDFMKWLVRNDWTSPCEFTPALFPQTGRGLMACRPIRRDEIIVKIPAKLLITVNTVSSSEIGWLFNPEKSFSTHQVLAAFLVWEKHLGKNSFWESYINLLPVQFSSPLFCCEEQLLNFPPFITKKVNIIKDKFNSLYEDLLKTMTLKVCKHCEMKLTDIYSKESFLWAWFIVNSRAVYLSPSHNINLSIKLYDDNCLALAPYLDLLNHSNNAKVQAYLLEDDGSYCLKTLVPYNKFEEVFIHYGSHSNIKLYVEYGFLLNDNKNDVVSIEFSDILESVSEVCQVPVDCSSFKYRFLQSHDMLTSLNCNSEGLSWNLKVVVFILTFTENFDIKTIYRKVFSNEFSMKELKDISDVGKILINKKKTEISNFLTKIIDSNEFVPLNEAVTMAVELLKELSGMLDKCRVALDNYQTA